METQRPDIAGPAVAPSVRRAKVHLIAAVDTNGLLSCGGRLPWEFKASGQIKTIADEVANRTVVIGRRAAIAMGGKPPGYNVIVLTLTPAQLRYSRTRKTDVERPVKGLWKGCQVARSVDDVFARCTADSLYVIGGRKTFELFLPFASEVICHVLQTALLDGAPPSPSNLYFPPMLREASLVNVGPDTAVESRFTARREQWRLEPVALPPTRDEATARVAIAKQTSAQPAPAPTAPARPATATPRALWFESTPVGAVMAKKVTLPAPASARAQSTAESALDHKYVGLVPAASANSDDEALREAIQASLLELSIASEMAAMQHHYQARSVAQTWCPRESALVPVGAMDDDILYDDDDEDDDEYADGSDGACDDDDWCCSDDDSHESASDDDDIEDDEDNSTGEKVKGRARSIRVAVESERYSRALPEGCAGGRGEFDFAQDVNIKPIDDNRDNSQGTFILRAPPRRLDRCPMAYLMDHSACVASVVAGYLSPADLSRLACVSKETLCALAELVALGKDTQPSSRSTRMPTTMARMTTSSLALARGMTKMLFAIATSKDVWTHRHLFGAVFAQYANGILCPGDNDSDDAKVGRSLAEIGSVRLIDPFGPTSGRGLRRAVMLLDGHWPLRDLWTLVESAEVEGRHDIVDACLSTFEAMDKGMHAYAARLWHGDTNDRIASNICRSMGLLLKEGCLRTSLLQSTWAPPLRSAHLAGRCRSSRLAAASLDAATHCVAHGIHLTRDGHQVLRLLGPEPHDPCAHAAAAAHVVSTVLAVLFDNLWYDQADGSGSINRVFDLVKRTICDAILPVVNRRDDVGSSRGTSPSDPAYKAALDQAFDTLCSRLMAFLRLRDYGMDSLSSPSSPLTIVFYRTVHLVGKIVREDVSGRRSVSSRLVSLWPEIAKRLWRDDNKDASTCLLLMAGISKDSTASLMPVLATAVGHQFGPHDKAGGGDNETETTTFSGEVDPTNIAGDGDNAGRDLLTLLLDGDPAVAAHLFSYLGHADMGSLAFASRRAFLLVARMIMPRHQGRPAIVPHICDRSYVYQADCLTVSYPCLHLLDPLFDDDGNERPTSLGRGLALVGIACRRLPRLHDAVIRLVSSVKPRDRRASAGNKTSSHRISLFKQMRQIEEAEEIDLYKRISDALADLIAAAVNVRSGSVASAAILLTSHIALQLGAEFAGSAGEVCFASLETDRPSAGALGAALGRHRQLSIDWQWYPVLSLVRVAARQRDVQLFHVACAMAHQNIIAGSPERVASSLAIAILDSAIGQLEQTHRGPDDDATAHFLDCLAASMPRDATHADRLQLDPTLSGETTVPKAAITSLSLRLFLLCGTQRTVGRRCAELIRLLASLAL